MDHAHPSHRSPPQHALALHVGFAGSRDLGLGGVPAPVAEARLAQLVSALEQELQGLTARLGLHQGYFLVGLSQLAVGADSVFADACSALKLPHRLLLPQPRDGFLDARGSTGPDFDEAQKAAALQRFDASNVIQERVVSSAADRHTRFRECSFEILRLADVVISLQPKETSTAGKPGGTREFLDAAQRHGKPALVCEFAFDAQGQLQWSATLLDAGAGAAPQPWPQLPALFDTPLPRERFVEHLKTAASARAEQLKQRFERRMQVVIGAHVGATALASAALALSYAVPGKNACLLIGVAVLLVLELALLAWGWFTHQRLHHDQDTHHWAVARLAAEVARSAQTLGKGKDRVEVDGQVVEQAFAGQHTYLKALFDLPMPEDFRALNRTLNVLHLESTLPNKHAPWQLLRDRYVRERLDTELTRNRGQIPYFRKELAGAEHAVHKAHNGFNAAVATAVLATTVKLILPLFAIKLSPLAAALSWLAIVMPVLAVAVMSTTANLDKEARKSTYEDVLRFLRAQRTRLLAAETEPEFLRLQTECEAKLLSEAIHWYYRRRFVNPA